MTDNNMIVLFPAYPGDMKRVDPAFEDEMLEAKKQGFKIGYVDVELMFGGDVKVRIPKLDKGDSAYVMYRGWILKQEHYNALNEHLIMKCDDAGRLLGGLIQCPLDYRYCQNIPEWYPDLKGKTPETVWLPGTTFDEDEIHKTISVFGNSPAILKDYMKSRKQDWYDACFIADASDKTEVMRVVNNFLRLQGDSLQGGLVFRKYEELEQIGIHPKSKMPLVNEWRCFVFNRGKGPKVIAMAPYWEGGWYSEVIPDIEIPNLPAQFYTVDVAKKKTGEWIIIEIGDGGSSGIPTAMKPYELYLGWSKRYEETIVDQMQRVCQETDS
jgi:hypothetical protein